MKFVTLIIALLLTGNHLQAAANITLMLSGSGKTVANLAPDATGSATFNNLPDGKYKLEIVVNAKHFRIDTDADGDGNADLEVVAQRDPTSGKVTFKPSKQLRLTFSEAGKKKVLTASEWSAITSKSTTLDNAKSVVAIEIKVENSVIKVRVVYSPTLDETK